MKRLFLLISFNVLFISCAVMGGDHAKDGEAGHFKLSPAVASFSSAKGAPLDHGVPGKTREPFSWRQVTCFGLPGSGKSTLFRAFEYVVKELIPDQGAQNWINQDECGGDRRKFEAALRQAQETNTVILADKGNHLRLHRETLARLFAQNPKGKKPLLIEFSLDISDEVLLERIALRGKGHRSLQSPEVAQQVLAKWRGELNPIDGRDRCSFEVLSIHPRDPLPLNLQKILEAYFEGHRAQLVQIKETPDLIERALDAALKYEKTLEGMDITPRGEAPRSRPKSSKKGHTRGHQKKPNGKDALPTGDSSKAPSAKSSLPQTSSRSGAAALPLPSNLQRRDAKKEKEKVSTSQNPFGVLGTESDNDDPPED